MSRESSPHQSYTYLLQVCYNLVQQKNNHLKKLTGKSDNYNLHHNFSKAISIFFVAIMTYNSFKTSAAVFVISFFLKS